MINSKWIAILIVVVLLAGAGYWYYAKRRPVQPPAGAPIEQPALGGAIYDQAANPVRGKLPASVAPVPNPVKDIYKNPFE